MEVLQPSEGHGFRPVNPPDATTQPAWVRNVVVIHSGHVGAGESRAIDIAERSFDELSLTSDSASESVRSSPMSDRDTPLEEFDLGAIAEALEDTSDDEFAKQEAALRTNIDTFQQEIREEQERLGGDIPYPIDMYPLQEAVGFVQNVANMLVTLVDEATSKEQLAAAREKLEKGQNYLKIFSDQRTLLSKDATRSRIEAAAASAGLISPVDRSRDEFLKLVHDISEWRRTVQAHPEEAEPAAVFIAQEREAILTYCRSLEDEVEIDKAEWDAIANQFRQEKENVQGERDLRKERASWTYLTDHQKDTLATMIRTQSAPGADRTLLVGKVHKWMQDMSFAMDTTLPEWGTNQPEVGQQIFFREAVNILRWASEEDADAEVAAHMAKVLIQIGAGILKVREEEGSLEHAEKERRQSIESLLPNEISALSQSDFCIWLAEFALDHKIYRDLQGPELAAAHEEEFHPWLAQIAPLIEKRLQCVSRAGTIAHMLEGVLLNRLVPNRKEAFVFTAMGSVDNDGTNITLPTFQVQQVDSLDATKVQSSQGFYATPDIMSRMESARSPLMTTEQANAFVQAIASVEHIPWNHSPDGCYARAEAACQMLAAMGYDRANIRRQYVSSPNLRVMYKEQPMTWIYHVAVTIKVQGDAWVIIDPACNQERALTKDEWIGSFETEYTPSPAGTPEVVFESPQVINHDFSSCFSFTIPTTFMARYSVEAQQVTIGAHSADARIGEISKLIQFRSTAKLDDTFEKTPVLRAYAHRFTSYGVSGQMLTLNELEAWVSKRPTTLENMEIPVAKLEAIHIAAICKAAREERPQLARAVYHLFKTLRDAVEKTMLQLEALSLPFADEKALFKLAEEKMDDAKVVIGEQRYQHCLKILEWADSETPTYETFPQSLLDMEDLHVVAIVTHRLTPEQAESMLDALVAGRAVVKAKLDRESTPFLQKLLEALDKQIQDLNIHESSS